MQAKAVCCTHLRLRLSAAELGATSFVNRFGLVPDFFLLRGPSELATVQSFSTCMIKIIEKWLRDGPVAFALLRSSFLFFLVCLAISRPNTQISKYASDSASTFEPDLLVQCQRLHPVATSPDASGHAFSVAVDRCPNDAEFVTVAPTQSLSAAPRKECHPTDVCPR